MVNKTRYILHKKHCWGAGNISQNLDSNLNLDKLKFKTNFKSVHNRNAGWSYSRLNIQIINVEYRNCLRVTNFYVYRPWSGYRVLHGQNFRIRIHALLENLIRFAMDNCNFTLRRCRKVKIVNVYLKRDLLILHDLQVIQIDAQVSRCLRQQQNVLKITWFNIIIKLK